MNAALPRNSRRTSHTWMALVAGGCVAAAVAWAQSPALTITAPVSGAIVLSGGSLAIKVAVVPGTYPPGVGIFAQAPLDATAMQPATGGSLNFLLPIPDSTSPGPYHLTAFSLDAKGNQLTSTPISVQVERPDQPSAVNASPPWANLRFVGDSLPLTIIGTFAGQMIDLTNSSYLVVTPENPLVATWSNGVITAVGSGQTTLKLQYGALSAGSIAVTVPAAARGDLNGDGVVDKSDLNIIMAALNTAANGQNDARDLNHDGVINALDARILVTLCTHPGCASH